MECRYTLTLDIEADSETDARHKLELSFNGARVTDVLWDEFKPLPTTDGSR